MVIPAKGDFFGPIGGIPINAEARCVAEAWDPRDEAAGEICGFGAAASCGSWTPAHRLAGREYLAADTDAGMQ